ncbi:MAG: septum formation initiator family protein [Planctomycetota bacterium]|nr:septum formation initiator family protein [Planctomycetota bacterium]
MEESVIQTDKWTARLASGWIFWPVCLGGIMLVALAVLGPEAERRLDVERQCAAMQAEVDSLTQTRDQLATVEKALQGDQHYLERTVRHELGIVRPGETRLPQKVKVRPPTASAAARAEADQPTPLAVLALFANPHLRFMTMVIGTAMLVIGILVSMPGKKQVAGHN